MKNTVSMKRSVVALVGAVALMASMGANGGCGNTGVKNSPDKASKAKTVAHLGDAITLAGNDHGSKISVAAVRVVDPVRATDGFSSPDPGNRYVAVRFRFTNTGSVAYDDAPSNGAKVVDDQGEQFEADFVDKINAGVLLPAQVKAAPGGLVVGYLVFQVPKKAKVAKVQFSMDSGFGETGEWTL
ncbi:MAG: hypothetical protein QOC82_1123 [Frankiaceae bacterium]|jgi:hypothetical protein|nr:hypothetical protein [Frankiaceae bacterium]